MSREIALSPVQQDERQIDIEDSIRSILETTASVVAIAQSVPRAAAFVAATRKRTKVLTDARAAVKRTKESSQRAERVRHNAIRNAMSPGYIRGLTYDALRVYATMMNAEDRLEAAKGDK